MNYKKSRQEYRALLFAILFFLLYNQIIWGKKPQYELQIENTVNKPTSIFINGKYGFRLDKIYNSYLDSTVNYASDDVCIYTVSYNGSIIQQKQGKQFKYTK